MKKPTTETEDRWIMYIWTVSCVLCGEKMYVNRMAQRRSVILWLIEGNFGYKSLYSVFLNLNVSLLIKLCLVLNIA